jgi:hypothetical protein
MTSQQPDNHSSLTEVPGLSSVDSTSFSSGDVQSQAVEIPLPDLPDERYAGGFAFKDPVELLYFVDDEIASGRTALHPWQVQFMMDFADSRNVKDHPFMAEVCAANGSGKDKYILAACAVWMCLRYLKAYAVATNGSGQQLDAQTEFHIRSMCMKFNSKIGFLVWKCNYRSYQCRHNLQEPSTHSVIELFATDEPSKAEGYHPVEDGSKLAIFASEAKSIPDEIFAALTRCTGFTHWVDVSSPGLPAGYFFNQWTMAIDRKELKDIKECPPTERVKWTITAYDCPHITENQIELFAKGLAAQGGRNSTVFKSGVLAQFGTTDEMTVISYTHIHRCKAKPPKWEQEPHNHGGLDLNSGGGAESVLKVRNGNKIIATEAFKFEDTEDNIDYCEDLFYKWGLDNPDSLIWGDSCGAGYPQLCSLRKRGWFNIRFFDSRAASRRPKVYTNIVTEMWFDAALLFQRAELILDGDMLTETQLCTRYYKINLQLKHQLLSKLEQKNMGYPSPDRADALIYCLIGYKSPWKERTPTADHTPVKRAPLRKPQPRFNQQMLVNQKEQGSMKNHLGPRPEMNLLQLQIDELNRRNRHNITNKAERD